MMNDDDIKRNQYYPLIFDVLVHGLFDYNSCNTVGFLLSPSFTYIINLIKLKNI